MPIELITPPASEPITLAEAKDHLRLESDLDDAYVEVLISAARSHVEQACWRAMVTQTFDLVLDGFRGEDLAGAPMPCRPYLELPRGNLGEIVSVIYIDAAGAEQTLSTSAYEVDTVSRPGRIRLAIGQEWPSTQSPKWDAVRIQYTVGWDFVAEVWQGPTPLRQAMLLLISQMYEHRTPEVFGSTSQIQFAVDSLLRPYRLARGM